MKRPILLLFALICTLGASAETWIQIESKDQVVVDGTYIITFRNDEGYFHTLYSEWWDYAGVYRMRSNAYSDNSYPNVASLSSATTKFRIEHSGGKWYLYSLADEKYVSTAEGTTQLTQFQLKDTPDEACVLTIKRDDGVLAMMIGDRYFQRNEASSDYKLLTSRAKKTDIELWRLDDGTEPEVKEIDFDTDNDFQTEDFYGTVKLHRTFINDEYNTLILPFAVENYTVFGSDLTVLELKSVSGSTMTFKPVEGSGLKENTPYLIKGTFSKSDFTFKNRDIEGADTQKEHKYTRGSITFHAKYQQVAVGGTVAYILFKGEFYQCKQIPTMTVLPTRWYLTSSAAENQAPMRIVVK